MLLHELITIEKLASANFGCDAVHLLLDNTSGKRTGKAFTAAVATNARNYAGEIENAC